MKIVWHGKEVANKIHDTLENRLKIIGELGKRDIKQMLKKGGGAPGSGGKGRHLNRSKPGEPPHVDSGRLWRSIQSETEGGFIPKTRIGTNVTYAKWLELGTSQMAARPCLRPWLDGAREDVTRILGQRIE